MSLSLQPFRGGLLFYPGFVFPLFFPIFAVVKSFPFSVPRRLKLLHLLWVMFANDYADLVPQRTHCKLDLNSTSECFQTTTQSQLFNSFPAIDAHGKYFQIGSEDVQHSFQSLFTDSPIQVLPFYLPMSISFH